jgi:hypothetical protein
MKIVILITLLAGSAFAGTVRIKNTPAIEDRVTRAAAQTAARIAVRELIKSDVLTADELTAIAPLYPKYEAGKTYTTGDIIRTDSALAIVIQPHTATDSEIDAKNSDVLDVKVEIKKEKSTRDDELSPVDIKP